MEALPAAAYGLYLHVLSRAGGAERLAALPLPVDPARRPLAALAVATWGVLWLYAGLSAGPHPALRAFRAAGVVLGLAFPLAALGAFPGIGEATAGGTALLALLAAGLVHRGLAGRRRPGTLSRAVAAVRLGAEGGALLLFGAAALFLARGAEVPLRLAFWALFLLRLSVSDLLDPATQAAETGLTRSAARDVKAAVGSAPARRRPALARRLRRGLAGLAKGALVAVWLALPLAAVLAPGEVEAGAWPEEARALVLYPPLALGLTAALLLAAAARDLPRAPVDSVRALLAGLGTALYVGALYGVPSFAAYRASVPALVLLETAFGFLLGAAPRDR